MLLLFAPLGTDKPLGPAHYQEMKRMLETLGPGSDNPQGEVSAAELMRLGLGAEPAQQIIKRLGREQELERYLSSLQRLQVTALTRISPEYPKRLWQVLGENAPMLLFCAGNLELLDTECVSLVGSRKLRAPGRAFARTLGQRAAEQGFTYVSGGAAGADTEGFFGAMGAGGRAVLFLADSLLGRMKRLRRELAAGRLLLISEQGCDLSFSAQRAHSRNRLIHAMGRKVFVAQSDYGSGGTWSGTVENLKAGWSPVYVCGAEPEDPGTSGLASRGACPVLREELTDLRKLEPGQLSLFPE